MAMKQANAAQKEWMTAIADFASTDLAVLYGDEFDQSSFQLHHVLGRSAKHNKVAIGHEFILPVPFDLHDVNSDHPENVTHCKKAFIKRFGNQRDLFNDLFAIMRAQGYTVPSMEIYNAIMDTHA
jgi:hypothetical protein